MFDRGPQSGAAPLQSSPSSNPTWQSPERSRTRAIDTSREELCQAFHVTRCVVDRLVNLGLPYYRLGRERWFFVDEFLGFVQRQLRRQKGGSKSTP